MISKKYSVLVVAIAGLFVGRQAEALCEQGGMTTSDQALLNTFPGFGDNVICPVDYVNYHWKAYNVPAEAWTGRGYDTVACDATMEYGKFWLSGYFIEHGIDFASVVNGTDSEGNPVELILDRAFHNSKDYARSAQGKESLMHDEFLHLPGEWKASLLGRFDPGPHYSPAAGFNFIAAAVEYFTSTDHVITYCRVYEEHQRVGEAPQLFLGPNPYGVPTTRAAVQVHEGMHAHYNSDFGQHVPCPTNPKADCDVFYPHFKGDFAPGELWRAGAPPPFGGDPSEEGEKISVYQLEHEFLCDIVDRPKGWVPMALIADAASDAADVGTDNFINAQGEQWQTPYECSIPSPMMAVPPAPPTTSCRFPCSSDAQCGGLGCLPNGCCGSIR